MELQEKMLLRPLGYHSFNPEYKREGLYESTAHRTGLQAIL
jgi:hypothetical protein